jgi:large subunit ribosomal protein L17
MWRNMATALFTHHQITTTIAKAKSLQPFVEKLITAAKKGDLASRRRVISKMGGDPWMLTDEDADGVVRHPRKANRPDGYTGKLLSAPRVIKHLFDDIAPMCADREGGYTRIIKLGINRLGDGGDLCVIQLVGTEEQGPQVSGQHSRRRDKANKRMEFAAKLRKGGAEDEKAEDQQQPNDAADPATAVAEADDSTQATTETPAAEAEAVEETSSATDDATEKA